MSSIRGRAAAQIARFRPLPQQILRRLPGACFLPAFSLAMRSARARTRVPDAHPANVSMRTS
jgi:hypothetical protein